MGLSKIIQFHDPIFELLKTRILLVGIGKYIILGMKKTNQVQFLQLLLIFNKTYKEKYNDYKCEYRVYN